VSNTGPMGLLLSITCRQVHNIINLLYLSYNERFQLLIMNLLCCTIHFVNVYTCNINYDIEFCFVK